MTEPIPIQVDKTDPSVLTTALVDRAVRAFREVIEARLGGMDTATALVADALKEFRAETDTAGQRQREWTTAEINCLGDLINSRISAMDKATELLAATVGRVPSDTDKAINSLRELLGARIDGMDTATKLLAAHVSAVPSDIQTAMASLREILSGEIRSVQDVSSEKFAAIDGTFASNALALTAALAAQKEAAAEQNKSNTLAITKSEQATKETILANAAQTVTSLKSLADRLDDLKERVDRGEGQDAGKDKNTTAAAASINTRLVMAGVAISIVVIIVNVLIAYATHK